jgi:preprotein translocase subunit SecF
MAIAGIMAYIAWAFRKVSRPVASWKYGLGAVIALAHDILITVGFFSVLGHFVGIEVGIPFIAALLTILGFSVHDTIVVYDRTRENLLRSSSKELFPEIVNRSLNETLVRSINTSLTVLVTLLAIFIFGGDSIKDFSLALIIGVAFGTYSSIFVASALLVTSYNWQLKKK